MVKAQNAPINDKDVENINIDSNPDKLFSNFMQSQTCHQTFSTFLELCQAINLQYPPSPASSSSYTSDYDHIAFYPNFKKKLSSWKAQSLWSKLDKRFYGKEFFKPKQYKSAGQSQRAGADTKVLIIGAGPCGLRTAIDMACLGTKVVVLEKRENFSRNNVLHLWPFIITDLKALGAKKLYGRFCAGAIDHISIRQLQLILLKFALMLGVEIIFNVSFNNLVPPPSSSLEGEDVVEGWAADVEPSNHPISKFSFDVVVGADGKRNTLRGFKRKEFRGKLAIGLTVNFINRNTTAEAKVEEISGVAYIFNQEFFKGLHKETGIDLENIVYYKGETHYFVMTAKKRSLISKGVLKQDYDDTSKLLSYENVDRDAMLSYAKEAADFSTHHQLPTLDFAINHFGEPDVALFDFTCMYAAENAALFREENGYKLLSCLVGDSLLEPFWPMGTGCARGFLAGFDTVWATRQWSLKNMDFSNADNSVELQVLAERESIYRLLHQTTPQNTMKNMAAYTIDPNTRYVNLNTKVVTPRQVRIYYLSDRPMPDTINSPNGKDLIIENKEVKNQKKSLMKGSLKRNVSMIRSSKLLSWSRRMTEGYEGVRIADMSSSWRSGLAICALIHRFRPDLINWSELNQEDVEANNQLAFDVAEKQLGISPVMTGKEMASNEKVDKLLMVTYISQFYEIFKLETPTGVPQTPKQSEPNHENEDAPKSPTGVNLSNPVGLLTRLSQHLKKRSYSVHGKNEEQSKKKKHASYKKKEDTILPKPSLTVLHEHSEDSKHKKSGNVMQVGETTVKLRDKNPDAGQSNNRPKVSDRISALSNQLISQWEQNAPQASPQTARRPNDAAMLSVPSSNSDMCYFCERRVYIVERLSAEGRFFHRHCFVCFHCGLTLRRGAYEYVRETGKFFCRASCITADQSKLCKYKKSTDNVQHSDPVQKVAKSLYQTPERIEIENVRFSKLPELQELTEEDQTRHNLTLPRGLELPVDEDELMSDSSSDDDDWEEIMKEANAKEVNDYTDSSTFGIDSSLEDSEDRSDISLADISTDESSETTGASSSSHNTASSSFSHNSSEKTNEPKVNTEIITSFSQKKMLVNGQIVDKSPESVADTMEKPTSTDSQTSQATLAYRDSFSSASTSSQVDDADMLAQLTSPPDPTEQFKKSTVKKPRTIFNILRNSKPNKVESNDESKDVVAELKQTNKVPVNPKAERKYDTLDRVQDYLQKTPIGPQSSSEEKKESRRLSSCSTISLSSVSTDTDADEILNFIDDDSSNESPAFDSAKNPTNFTSLDGKAESFPVRDRRIRIQPLQAPANSIMINSSRLSCDKNRVETEEEDKREKSVNDSVNESLISEYHPPLREEDHQKPHPPFTRKLSYDSMERRMKFRLRARNRWLRQESNQKSLSRSSSVDESPENEEQAASSVSPGGVSSNMVIIETTPSVDNPLTPTAPPISRQQSHVDDSDYYFTPVANIPKSPPPDRSYSSLKKSLEFDVSGDYVSAASTPSVFSQSKTPDSNSKRELPTLPKVPYLEAISPTGSANNTLSRDKKKSIDDEMEERENRVKRRIEEKKSLQKSYSDHLLQDPSQDGLDASFTGYSPVPSRKKTSLKNRNRKTKSPVKEVNDEVKPRRRIILSPSQDLINEKSGKKLRKKDIGDKSSAQIRNGDVEKNKEKRSSRLFFGIGNRKKNKIKKEKSDDVTTLERRYPNQSDRERAMIRGERFRVATASILSPPGSFADDDPANYWAQRRRSHLASLTPEQIDAKITRRVQIAARRQAKLEAQKRLRRAQVIQRQLEEIEVKQKDLEERGVELEKLLRGDSDQRDESLYMQEWFKLVQDKNALLRYENELMIHQRELQLEDAQSRLQQELRERMAMDDKKKTSDELDEEKEILRKMLDVVEQRDGLVALLEEQRLKEKDEFVDTETLLLNKFNGFPNDDFNCSSPSRGLLGPSVV